jgi:hypothetical protein
LDRARKAWREADDQIQSLTAQQEQRILQLGAGFKQSWESELCTIELKKKILRTVIEEIIVRERKISPMNPGEMLRENFLSQA